MNLLVLHTSIKMEQNELQFLIKYDKMNTGRYIFINLGSHWSLVINIAKTNKNTSIPVITDEAE